MNDKSRASPEDPDGTVLSMAVVAFSKRLSAIRKARDLTQQQLAQKVGISLIQIHRYEAGSSHPTLDVIRKLAVTLGVSADALLFDTHERQPDEELRLQFEAISQFSQEEKKVVKTLLDSLILKHQAKRWATG